VEDTQLVVDLVIALGAAFLGGLIAQRLGLPVLLGYIVAGVAIGPNTPGLVADRHNVELLANLGVALLMFDLGVEFSFNELKRVRRIALIAGGIQIPLTILLGTAVSQLAGWSIEASLLLGGAFSISSSIVALKLLMGRGEAGSRQARVALGLGIIQDLSLVPMIALLPILSGEEGGLVENLARSLGITALALILVVGLGSSLVSRLLYYVAKTGSRELFLLTIVLIALGTAIASQEAGLSLALGAFLAGLVVSESEFDSQVLAEIVPIRDLFATLFFVSVGMLLDPNFLVDQFTLVLGFTAALVIGKLLITGGALLAARVDHRTTTIAALLMAQMGEFSFVLAGVGRDEGIINDDQYGLVLATSLGSILIVPFLLAAGPWLVEISEHLPGVATQEQLLEGPEPPEEAPRGHIVLVGYGRVGAVLGKGFTSRGLQFTVIEINPAVVRALREEGIHAYYGDASSDRLLHRTGIDHAETLVIAIPDLVITQAAIRHAKRLNPKIVVVARANAANEVEILRAAGADWVAQPEFEAGMELLRHVLRLHDVAEPEADLLVDASRDAFYAFDGVESDAHGRVS
jgi:CPA2 family monovalent cation:H+ antiporter-2